MTDAAKDSMANGKLTSALHENGLDSRVRITRIRWSGVGPGSVRVEVGVDHADGSHTTVTPVEVNPYEGSTPPKVKSCLDTDVLDAVALRFPIHAINAALPREKRA
jgi:hypothetical protein